MGITGGGHVSDGEQAINTCPALLIYNDPFMGAGSRLSGCVDVKLEQVQAQVYPGLIELFLQQKRIEKQVLSQ